MMLKRITSAKKEKIFVTIGSVLLATMVLSAWVPRSCSYLRQALSVCPASKIAVPITYQDREIARIPNNIISGNVADFSIPGQDYRDTTMVYFDYLGDTAHEYAYLQVMQNGNFKNISLVTLPLLKTLDWSRTQSAEPEWSMYQKNETFSSVEALHANLPPKSDLAVDQIVADAWKLNPSQYQALEGLADPNSVSYIVTSYTPPQPNGSWSLFSQTFDLSSADLTESAMHFRIYKPLSKTASQPFRISMVHVNFQRLSAP
jgi:hypothetical protein